MSLTSSGPLPLFLLCVVSAGYLTATLAMKMVADGSASSVAAGLLALGLAAVVLGEIALLRGAHLSVVYIGILASETLLALAYAAWIGEGVTLRQGVGAAFVLTGAVVVLQ
ncbi:5-aminolevulinate synthase [Litorisediminicola beolgyonensis]|uniref:5-aminolevulinate synthase n=1 Tax=Litorisediminicola beolgyonensis TaxID=1173614 RepID=A0ABW3ZEX9_9RHOB